MLRTRYTIKFNLEEILLDFPFHGFACCMGINNIRQGQQRAHKLGQGGGQNGLTMSLAASRPNYNLGQGV